MKITLILTLLFAYSMAVGQVTDTGYNLPKPLPTNGALPASFIKPGGPYGPTAYSDSYPATYSSLVWGGHRQYGTVAERDAAKWKVEGMTAYCADTQKTYRLNSSMVWVETDPSSDIVYLRDYGAVGDGVTDDTAAVNAAIAASYNKILDIGQGLYVVSPIVVSNAVSIIGHHLYGETDVHTAHPPSTYSGFLRKAGTSGSALFTFLSYGELHYIYFGGNKAAASTSGDCLAFPSGRVLRPFVIDHLVIVDHAGAGITVTSDYVDIDWVRIMRMSGTGIALSNSSNTSVNQADIAAVAGNGMSLTDCRYIRVLNQTMSQISLDGVLITDSSQNYFKDGTIGETGARAFNITHSSGGSTNNLFEGITTRNANALALPLLTGFTPLAEGSVPAVGFNSSGFPSDGNTFYRCTFNVAHHDSTYQTAIGNRKASYCVAFVAGDVNPAARLTFSDCYFAGDRTVSGPYQSWLPDKAMMINCGSDTSAGAQTHYFGTAAAFGNALAVIKGIGTSPASTSYAMVWDNSSKQVSAIPQSYGNTFGWKPMPTKRILYYAYETYANNLTAVGSHSWTGAGTGGTVGTLSSTPTDTSHPSCIRLNSSTATSSGYTISTRSDMFGLSSATHKFTMNGMFRIVAVSNPTDRWTHRWSFGDTSGAADVDGFGLTHIDDQNSGNWRLFAANNSSYTYSDGTIAPTNNVWNAFSFSGTTTGVNGTVNGVAFPALSGGMPTTTARAFGISIKIYTAAAVASARSMDIDWFEVIVEDTAQDYVPIANLQFFENMTLPWQDVVAFRVSE